MKKKLAVLLAGVMVAAVVPVTAMAGTTTYVNRTFTVEKGDFTDERSLLTIKDGNKDLEEAKSATIVLELDGAEWTDDSEAAVDAYSEENNDNTVTFEKISDTKATVEIKYAGGTYTYIPLVTKVTDKGDVTVTVDSKSSVISGGTFTYAVAIAGSASAKIANTVNIADDGTKIKDITISETTAGALEEGILKLKLSKNFKWGDVDFDNLKLVVGDDYLFDGIYADGRELEIYLAGGSDSATEFILTGLVVEPDDADFGDVAEITVSGCGIDKTTLEAGTYTDYGVNIAIYDEDEEMPVFYSGKVYDEEEDVTLAVQLKENIADSINDGRKLTFTFTEGVKVVTGYDEEAEGVKGTGVYIVDENDTDANEHWAEEGADYEIKNNVVTIKDLDTTEGKKAKMTFAFNLAISPEFTGDVEVTVGGSAIDNEATFKVAEVIAPFTVEAEINEVNIDYRNVAVSDIVIKEVEAGVFEEDEVIIIGVENMQFEKGMDFEVTAGDLEVDDIEVSDGLIFVTLKEESVKEAGEITLSNVQLYLDRSLPAGNYDLLAKASRRDYDQRGDAWYDYAICLFQSYYAERKAGTPYFDVDEVVMVPGYIKVITAGRDQDDATFTTQIVVPVGESTIYAGAKSIAIDAPAFINADGYTMMPLRAVVEALSGAAIVTWDDATKTVTVLFGARVISMTIGQKAMMINGVAIAMTAAPVIVDSRTFLPLRDLGYALGLNDSQIAWDAETKTATLN